VRRPTRLDADSEDLHEHRRTSALHGASSPSTSVDLLYVTDRAPVTEPDGSLAYSSDRSRSMAFGSVSVEIGESVAWPILAEQSKEDPRKLPLELHLG
jgi:esterase/lipase superfamily enzyme